MEKAAVVSVVFGTAAVALFITITCRLWRLRPGLLGAQFTFTERHFRSVVDQWGPEGLARFRSHFVLDYCFLACYGLFGLALGFALQSAVPWILPAAAVFDAIENLLHQRFATAAPNSLPKIAFLAAGVSSSMKWALIAAFLLWGLISIFLFLGSWVFFPRAA